MKTFFLRKGHNLKIDGAPKLSLHNSKIPKFVTFHPSRIKSFKTKLLVKLGDAVKVGTPLFFDKNNSDIMYVSSVSGEVVDILFGDRRIVKSIKISNDKSYNSENVDTKVNKEVLMKSGLWSLIRQKPFSKVPNSDSIPESFYISAMPTEPFAINCNFLFSNVDNYIQHGINILKEIFNCEIHFSSNKDSAFKSLDNVNHYTFNELHPAGNIGIQIHHINPIKDSRDTRWYLSMQDLNNIGFYFKKNKYPNFKYFSVGGNGVSEPGYYNTLLGTPINDMLTINENNTRLISGDVLSGNETTEDFSLDYYDDILSAINTSSARQFIGWLLPGLRKYSLTNVFLSKLIRNKKSTLNTNLNGSLRTIISMGNWDSVLPMNIYPEFLVKSILAKDIDMMEKLGILEVSPEDLSLCSFICQSKTEVSKIIEDGLNLIQEEI